MNIPYAFKRCNKCGRWLVASKVNFHKKDKKWGLDNQCKECRNKKQREKYANDKEWREEKLRKNKERWNNNEEYKEERNKKNREYYKEKYANDEEWREKQKRRQRELFSDDKYREEQNRKQREKYANKKEWREEKLEKGKKWRKNNQQKVFNLNNERRNKEENQGNGITKEQWKEMFDFFNFKCAYSGEYIGGSNKNKKRIVDHILALDNGGLNEIWNCTPMLKSYNSSKNKRIDVINWYKEQEYFDEERLQRIVEWQKYAYEKWATDEDNDLILITDLI